MAVDTARPDAPFFLAEGRGVVLVMRSVGVTNAPDSRIHITKAYERTTPAEDRAWADAADVLARALPEVEAYANPLVIDEWQSVIKSAAAKPAGSIALVCSAPGGVDVASQDVLAALQGCPHPWLLDHQGARGGDWIAKAAGAWLWEIADLPGRVFLSNWEPPHDRRVVDVVSPDGKSREARDKITKADRRVRIVRKDEQAGELRVVLGIVLEPEVVDAQNDVYDADEIARAAHGWMEDYQNIGHMHRVLVNNGVKPVESYLCPVDCEIGGQQVKAGTWLMAVHVISDAIWAQVKAGELTGFSIGGYAQRVAAQNVPEGS